jgi:hypothetical protein
LEKLQVLEWKIKLYFNNIWNFHKLYPGKTASGEESQGEQRVADKGWFNQKIIFRCRKKAILQLEERGREGDPWECPPCVAFSCFS